MLACAGCPAPNVVAPPTVTPPPSTATPRPVATATFGAPVFPVPRPIGTPPPDPTPQPTLSPTPGPVPTTGATTTPGPEASPEPTLPPPPGIQAYDLPQLGVNVGTMHGGKGPGDANGYTQQTLLRAPVGLAYAPGDIVYIADTGNHVIRSSKVETLPTGATRLGETYAGNGTQGFADGLATAAKFDSPRGVAAGPNDSVYIADTGNHRIRRVFIPATDDKSPVCQTIAGSTEGHKDAVGTDSQFSAPWGVAVDKDGNAYVTDTGNHCIRKITPALVVTTLAGVPGASGHKDGAGKTAQFADPKGITVDNSGNLYVCDAGNHCIRKISSAGIVTTIAGIPGDAGLENGPGTQAQFDTPIGIGLNKDGSLYVSDFGNNRIRLVSTKFVVSTFAGTGEPGDTEKYLDGPGAFARFNGPQGIVVDDAKDIYVAEEGNHSVRKLVLEPVVTTEFGSTTPGSSDEPLVLAGFKLPHGIAYDGVDTFYIADSGNHTIRVAKKNGAVSTLAGKAGSSGDDDGKGDDARFDTPRAVACDKKGNVWVADEGNHRIRKIAPDGTVTTVAGSGEVGFADGKGTAAKFNTPRGLALGLDGELYVADFGNHRIRRVDPDGTVTTYAGDGTSGFSDGPVAKARFVKPSGVSVDKEGRVYVADFGNNAIRVIQQDPATSALNVGTLAGSLASPGYKDGGGGAAQFNDPWGLTVDAVGRVFVADFGNSLIRKITPDGTVSTYVGYIDSNFGTPLSGYADGPGSKAKFAAPSGVAIDELGYVYVVDTENNCIRRIH
jgi:streptogramin lyase